MAYHKAEEVIQRWIDVTEGRAENYVSNRNTPIVRDRLYSYGTHFELARPLRSRAGRVKAYVLNGDTPWNTGGWNRSATPGQQWYLREHVTLPKVIIPFAALEGAGVSLDTIRIIHILQDRHEVRKHHSETFPSGAYWHDEGIYEHVDLTPEEIANKRDITGRHVYPGQTRAYRQVASKKVLRTSFRTWTDEITVTRDDHANPTGYDWETRHHWLGEALIRARVSFWGADNKTHHRWAYFLSGFDHQEPAPLYFLCELPRGHKPATVADAYEILKPEPVSLAEQMGRGVTRQGDIFAIPAPTLDRRTLQKMGAAFEKRSERVRGRLSAQLLGTNHTATEVARLPSGLTLAKGCLYHDPSGRRRDHVRRKIGDGQGWHIILKNTVPVGRR